MAHAQPNYVDTDASILQEQSSQEIGLGNISESEQNSGVDPEYVIFLCDGIKCEPIDPETVQKEETHQQV